VGWLEQFRPQLDAIPFVGEARQAIRAYLEDPHSKEELVKMALGHVQSILLQAGGVFMGVMHVLLDIMLTVFFFGFFLQRIAAGQSDELGRQKPTGQYIVEAIFESGWMPDMRSSTLREAQIIIDDMLGMLQVWVRGYLWIILVETFLYTTIFMVLRVPFFALAGLVAGSTILLPVVGPLVGCSVTVLATLAVNPHGVTPAVGVMVAYLVIHGMLEQLFLYPSLVGQALGLNTLETIIVVLLGGLLAGLPGIIFAVPAAAIVKRLVPKIYAALRSRKGAENAEGAEGAESAF
jgi:predicted PurR-regulated permease PerM